MLKGMLGIIATLNSLVLRICKNIAWIALALMVIVILLQVIFRYVMNSALAWPDEAARFLMLWMTGLIAPMAYRSGGFVAIDMLELALPKRLGLIVGLVLLLLSTMVLYFAIQLGWNHTMGFGGNFDSSSLWVPLDWIGLEALKVKLRYMYGSLLVCVVLLLSVNIELIIRTFLNIISPETGPPTVSSDELAVAGGE